MTTIQQYTADDLPPHLMWQMLSFARMQWHNDIEDFGLPLQPAKWHPTYFVIADDQLLISAATVLWKTIHFQNQPYKLYGLGMVLTYPTHRKQGYGRQIIAAATNFIQQDTEADLALLQTAPYLEQFYGEQGWEHTPNIRVLSGDVDHPIDDDGWVMMLFLSQHTKEQRQNFEGNAFYLDDYIW